MWKWRSGVLIYSLFIINSRFFSWSSLHGKILYMHTKLIRHVKGISCRPTQLLWAVFHQISRQLTAVASGNLRQMATNHAKTDSVSYQPLQHPRSSEAQTSQEAGMHRAYWRSCTSMNHLHVHVHMLIWRCWICYSEEDSKLWCCDHFVAELFNIIKLCISLPYRIGSNTLATLTTGAGEALILLFCCERSGLKDSKSKSEFVPVLSSIGLEALYPLRHQEPSK